MRIKTLATGLLLAALATPVAAQQVAKEGKFYLPTPSVVCVTERALREFSAAAVNGDTKWMLSIEECVMSAMDVPISLIPGVEWQTYMEAYVHLPDRDRPVKGYVFTPFLQEY